ncbi:MAG: RnfH family protein [Gammaproteobacteria bacterium]|nr:RnfH family protein [Gammaproteobacteria bacterium]
MAAREPHTVEVAYALPERQRVVVVEFREGLTARQAVEAAGLLRDCPELAGRELDLGVFGRVVSQGHVVRPGDRVEIYRPLEADPRETRRRRAAAVHSTGKPAGGRHR